MLRHSILNILKNIFGEFQLSFLPPLMVYTAAGVASLTGIVGTFFVKDYLGLSAAFMAGLGAGVYKSLIDISKNWKIDKRFRPRISKTNREELLVGWKKAIRKTLV